MITVYQVVTGYTEKNRLQPATKDDLARIGSRISQYFRSTWCLSNPMADEPGLVEDTGFIIQRENDNRLHVVAGYPNLFRDEMLRLTHEHFDAKNKRIKAAKIANIVIDTAVQVAKKQRTRKPIKPRYSAKAPKSN